MANSYRLRNDVQQFLPELHSLRVIGGDCGDSAGHASIDRVHQLHDLNDADHRIGGDGISDGDERRLTWRGAAEEDD